MLGVATGSEECDAAPGALWERTDWEALIFIHDGEKVRVCWHKLLHLHSLIDCLPQRGSSVCLPADEPVLLTPPSCHALMLPQQKTLRSSSQERLPAFMTGWSHRKDVNTNMKHETTGKENPWRYSSPRHEFSHLRDSHTAQTELEGWGVVQKIREQRFCCTT